MSLGPDYIELRPDHEAETAAPPRQAAAGATSSPPDEQVERRGLRAAGQLVARTVLTRCIALVGTVALARLLTPADFGVYAVTTLIVTIITVVGDLGIGAGLVQQREEPDPGDLETVLAVQLLFFGGLGLAAAAIGPALAVALGLGSEAAVLALLMAVSILTVPLRGIPVAMLSRSLRFGPLAASEVIQQLVFFGVAVGLAAAGVGVVSFGLAAFAQNVVATIVVWAFWRQWPPRPRLHHAVAARLWRFGIRMQGAHIAAWAKDAVVPFFGGLAGGVSAVGYLQFAWRNGQMISALDDIVTRVGFPALSRLQQDRPRFVRASSAAMEASVLIAVGIQAWLIASAPVLIPLVFSPKWEPAVDAFQLVAAGAVAGTMSAVVRTALNAAGESGTAFRAAMIGLVVTLVAFPAGVVLAGVTGGGAAFLASSVVALAVNVVLARGRVRVAWMAVTRVVLMGAVAALVTVVIVTWRPDLAGLILSGLAYVATFGLLAIALEGRVLRILWAGVRPGRPRVPDVAG